MLYGAVSLCESETSAIEKLSVNSVIIIPKHEQSLYCFPFD